MQNCFPENIHEREKRRQKDGGAASPDKIVSLPEKTHSIRISAHGVTYLLTPVNKRRGYASAFRKIRFADHSLILTLRM